MLEAVPAVASNATHLVHEFRPANVEVCSVGTSGEERVREVQERSRVDEFAKPFLRQLRGWLTPRHHLLHHLRNQHTFVLVLAPRAQELLERPPRVSK